MANERTRWTERGRGKKILRLFTATLSMGVGVVIWGCGEVQEMDCGLMRSLSMNLGLVGVFFYLFTVPINFSHGLIE